MKAATESAQQSNMVVHGLVLNKLLSMLHSAIFNCSDSGNSLDDMDDNELNIPTTILLNAMRTHGMVLQTSSPTSVTSKPDIYYNACFKQLACPDLAQQ
jgi:hypothetical protein